MENKPKRKIQGWLQLFMGLIGIWAFIFLFTPLITSKGKPAQVIKYIQQNNIDATPLFYTESELAGKAVLELRIEN